MYGESSSTFFQLTFKSQSQTFIFDGEVNVTDLLSFFRSCTPGQLDLLSQICIIILILQLSVSLSVHDREVSRSHSNHAKKFSFSASLDLDVTPGSPLTTQRRHLLQSKALCKAARQN